MPDYTYEEKSALSRKNRDRIETKKIKERDHFMRMFQ